MCRGKASRAWNHQVVVQIDIVFSPPAPLFLGIPGGWKISDSVMFEAHANATDTRSDLRGLGESSHRDEGEGASRRAYPLVLGACRTSLLEETPSSGGIPLVLRALLPAGERMMEGNLSEGEERCASTSASWTTILR